MRASTSVARRAVVVNPFMGSSRALPRSAMRASTSLLARRSLGLLGDNMAVSALLIPIRGINTSEPRGPGGSNGSDMPPPGFKLDEAKKPISKAEAEARSKSKQKLSESEEKKLAGKTEARTEIAAADDAKTLTDLAAEKDSATGDKALKKEEERKLSLWQKVKHELQHYWDGTKLLATEVKISTRLAVKMAAGYELTRRENRQLQRTVQDLARLVPFSVFVIVPFAELLLPVALRLFPNLLPSTYEGQKTKEQKALKLRTTRKEVSDFLRGTLKETGLPLSSATARSEEFANFFRKVRATGERPTPEDVIRVCKIFKDDVTLDNLSRPQLVSMCRYLNLTTYGSDGVLRYQIRVRMRQIKADDRAIAYEGVDSLTVAELQMACASRGIRTHGVSPAALREDLQTWLDLRLRDGVPSTLLVLANAYSYASFEGEGDDRATMIDALVNVLSSIPEELLHEIELEVHAAEGAATNRQRLEVLKEQEELIDEELEQNEANSKSGVAVPADIEDIDEKEEGERLAARARAQQEKGAAVDQAQVLEASDAAAEVIREAERAISSSSAANKSGKTAPETSEK